MTDPLGYPHHDGPPVHPTLWQTSCAPTPWQLKIEAVNKCEGLLCHLKTMVMLLGLQLLHYQQKQLSFRFVNLNLSFGTDISNILYSHSYILFTWMSESVLHDQGCRNQYSIYSLLVQIFNQNLLTTYTKLKETWNP